MNDKIRLSVVCIRRLQRKKYVQHYDDVETVLTPHVDSRRKNTNSKQSAREQPKYKIAIKTTISKEEKSRKQQEEYRKSS